MKKVKGLFSIALIGTMLSLSHGNVWADPVESRGIVELSQPTQQLFKAEVQGDEWLSYAIVENTKELVVFGENNYWYYATIEANTNHLVATDSKFSIDAKPDNAAYEKDISKIKVDIPEINVVEPKAKSRSMQQKRNLLVVMIEFNDTPMDFTKNDWHNTIFASGKDSANDFYQEATKGLIQFTPVKNTQENTVDGVVKVKLDKNHPNTGFASDKYTLPREMINEALNQEKQTLNLKQYDTDNDGYLSPDELHVLAVFSGYSASATNASTGVSPTIHPHRWGGGISVDGVKVETYTAVTDKRKWYLTDPDAQSTIGTVVHELGHDLGLPDLYNPSNTQGKGLGSYSIMANSHTTMNGKTSGSYPVHFDAYSKVKLGLVEPTIITKEQTLTINEIQQNNFNVAKVETEDPKQYYLIENRQMKGFDAALAPYIHSGGVGIYYVNEHITTNEGAGKQIVTLREADQGVVGYSKLDSNMVRGLDGFYYKGIGMHNKEQTIELGRKTVPASTLPDGKNPKFDIIVNDESKDGMSVTFSNPKISVIDITLNPAKLSLDVGKIEQLTATITPDNATNKTVTWRSSDEKIATVDQKGLVTAQASGTVTITAETEDGKQTASSTVEVTSARGTYGTTPWIWDEPTQTLTFKKGDFPATSYSINIQKLIQEDQLKGKKVKKIKFEDTVSLNKDSQYLFAYLNELEEIEGIEKLNTSKVTNMSTMFYRTKITSLDLNTWDTSNVTNMSSMFKETKLKALNVSNWNISKVTQLSEMFSSSTVESLDLKNWDTSKVTDMSSLFLGTKMTQIDIAQWDTSNVTNMSHLFWNSKIAQLNVAQWNTSKVSNMSAVFGSTKIESLNLTNWDTSKATNMSYMFSYSAIEELTLGKNFTFKNATLPEKNVHPYTGAWISKDKTYNNNADFTKNYDGAYPGTYVRESDPNKLGTVPWIWDEPTQTLTFKKGDFPATSYSINIQKLIQEGQLKGEKVKKIKFEDTVSLNKDSQYLFAYLNELEEIEGIEKLNTSKVTNMSTMFYRTKITSLDLNTWDTSNVTNMSSMFKETKLKALNVSNWNISKVTQLSEMFSSSTVESLDLKNWDTSKVTDMSSLFLGTKMTQIDIAQWDTSNVTNMSHLFWNSKVAQLNVAQWNTSKVSNMSAVFGSTKIESLNLTNWDTSKATNMSYMFSYSAIEELTLGKNFTFKNATLPEKNVHPYTGAWISKDKTYNNNADFTKNYDGAYPGTYVRESDPNKLGTVPWIWDEPTQTLTFKKGDFPATSYSINIQKLIQEGQLKGEKVKKIKFEDTVSLNKDSQYLFAYLNELEEIEGIEKLNTSKVTNMSTMFYRTKITSLDLNTWDTSNVTNMSSMFKETKLKALNVSNWNISKVTQLSEMFSSSTVESLDLKNWDTSKVTDMSSLFLGTKMTQIDIAQWDTSNVTNMSHLFWNSKIAQLNVAQWNTSKVSNMSAVFGSTKIESLNLTNWDTSKATNMSYMFSYSAIEELTLGKNFTFKNATLPEKNVHPYTGAWISKDKTYNNNADFTKNYDGAYPGTYVRESDPNKLGTVPWIWDEPTQTLTFKKGDFPATSYSINIQKLIQEGQLKGEKVKKIKFEDTVSLNKDSQYLFAYLNELEEIEGIEKLNTSKVTNMSTMFYRTKITSLDLNTWDTSNVTNMSSMFKETKLKALNVSNWNISKVTQLSEMFSSSTVESLDLKNWDTSKVTDMSSLFLGTKMTQIDIAQWDTSNVTNMSHLFWNSKIAQLNVAQWNTSKVSNMSAVFGSTKIESLNLTNWDTSKATNMSYMFSYSAIEELTLGKNFTFKNATLPEKNVHPYTGAWISKDKTYNNSADFTKNYDGTYPGTYVREKNKTSQ
ncbi:hypothetical protein DOK67_0001195 [Enterococcus sp. DIV0212c]|uniref:BspA family leucine-rich repeat surface protein n=1 Tax=Enterococcus sp. DIV0212c TaxID=2230867 RepID=UPI0035C7943D